MTNLCVLSYGGKRRGSHGRQVVRTNQSAASIDIINVSKVLIFPNKKFCEQENTSQA